MAMLEYQDTASKPLLNSLKKRVTTGTLLSMLLNQKE